MEKEGGKGMAKYVIRVYDPLDPNAEVYVHYIKEMNKALYLGTRWSYAYDLKNAKIFLTKSDAKKIIKLLKGERELIRLTSEFEILEVVVVKDKIFIEKGRY